MTSLERLLLRVAYDSSIDDEENYSCQTFVEIDIINQIVTKISICRDHKGWIHLNEEYFPHIIKLAKEAAFMQGSDFIRINISYNDGDVDICMIALDKREIISSEEYQYAHSYKAEHKLTDLNTNPTMHVAYILGKLRCDTSVRLSLIKDRIDIPHHYPIGLISRIVSGEFNSDMLGIVLPDLILLYLEKHPNPIPWRYENAN